MLKRIPVAQVQLGMFLQSLEGSWLSHPFWKTRFVLREKADLEALLKSGVPAVWINIAKGLDVEGAQPGQPDQPAQPEPEMRPVLPEPDEVPEASTAAVTLDAEMARAIQLVNRSRQVVMALFGEVRLGKAVDAEQCLPVVEDVAASVARNPSALISLARLKSQDNYTYMHSVAVCALMVALARQLGLDAALVREAGLAGLLHDVGKMMMPAEVLNKPGALSDAEYSLMRTHPERGHQALLDGGAVPESTLEVCLRHHEKIDGSGYPGKLKGEEISLMARMGAICDVYDAITSVRAYKNAWAPADSIQRMAQWKGHFDPVIFQAFVKSVGIYPVGSLVRLKSDRLAVVVDQTPGNLMAPPVRVFYSARERVHLPVRLVDLSKPDCTDKIIGRESAQDWGFTNLDDYWRKPELHANH